MLALLVTSSHLQSEKNKVAIDYRAVKMQPLDSEMEHVPPKARVY